MKEYLSDEISVQLAQDIAGMSLYGQDKLIKQVCILTQAAIADWIKSQSGELPELPGPDERTRKGFAFSGFAMTDYAREAIAAAKGKMGEQEPFAWVVDGVHFYLVQQLQRDGKTPISNQQKLYAHPMPSQQAAQPEVEQLVREIHQAVKRGEDTQDHGLIGNLRCILDHVLPDVEPFLGEAQPAPQAQPAKQEPLTRDQIKDGCFECFAWFDDFESGVHFAERIHGIKGEAS